jgi:uncharacterized protein YcfJ
MSALSTAMQGAQLGGKFGGAYGAAGGAILGFLAGSKATKEANEATKKYNDQVVKYAAQDLFDLRRQQNVENVRTAQALAAYQSNKQVQNSAITASLGAADIIGSSAQALKQVMDFQTQEAKAEAMLNWETGIENYNTTIDRAENQRNQQFKRQNAAGQEDLGALVSGAVGVYNASKGGSALTSDDFNIAKNKVKYAGYSLMGQLSTLWDTPKGTTVQNLNSGVVQDTMKTFGVGERPRVY